MQVILLEKINHLGDLGAIVKVKDGYSSRKDQSPR